MKNNIRIPVLITRAAGIVNASPGSFNGINIAEITNRLTGTTSTAGGTRLQQLAELTKAIHSLDAAGAIKLYDIELFRPLFPKNFSPERARITKNQIGEAVLQM